MEWHLRVKRRRGLRCSGSEARANDIAQARSEDLREREENWDDPAIDEVRHLLPGPDPALPLLEVRLYREEEPQELSESEGEVSSTTASEWSEDSHSPSMGGSEEAQSLGPGESEAFGFPETGGLLDWSSRAGLCLSRCKVPSSRWSPSCSLWG